MDTFALVKRYRGRQQIVATGTLEFCEAQMFKCRFLARPLHTKNFKISYYILPIRRARSTKVYN